MNAKKIIMIIILILVILGIVFAIIKVNEKSTEKISGTEENTSTEAKKDEVLKITDNYFIEQTNDIFINLEDYVGKEVEFEGLIYSYEDEKGNTLYAVVRNTPGCCGNDGLAGLDIRYDKKYPKKDTWVEVTGVIESETVDGTKIPVVKLSSMTKKEAGTTFVTN